MDAEQLLQGPEPHGARQSQESRRLPPAASRWALVLRQERPPGVGELSRSSRAEVALDQQGLAIRN